MHFLAKKSKSLFRMFFLWFLVISLVPLIGVSLLHYREAQVILSAHTYQSLEATLQLEKAYIERFYSELQKDLRLNSSSQRSQDFLKALQDGYTQSGEPLMQFINSGLWSRLSEGIGDEFAAIIDANHYRDILLLNKAGDVLFSLKERNLGTNLIRNKDHPDGLRLLCKQALDEEQLLATDAIEGAIYFANVMKDSHDKLLGLMVIYAPIKPIKDFISGRNQLAIARANENQLRKQTYLVGSDMSMRLSPSPNGAHTDKVIINTPPVQMWIEDLMSSQPDDLSTHFREDYLNHRKKYLNHRKKQVLGTYRNLVLLGDAGPHWVLVGEVEKELAFAPMRSARNTLVVMTIFLVFLVALLAFGAAKQITLPIKDLTDWIKGVAAGNVQIMKVREGGLEIGELRESFVEVVVAQTQLTGLCKALALGDFSNTVTPRDQGDVLLSAVKQVTENLRAVVLQASTVASGDYSTNFQLSSDQDELGLALQNMTRRLTTVDEQNRRNNWLSEGEAQLNEIMRGEIDLVSLCNKVITFLAQYTNAYVAALFICEDQILRLKGSYAYQRRKGLSNTFEMGEGLVGQAALEQKQLIITQIPDNYILVHSGLGDHAPTSVVLTPLFFDSEVVGIIELGTFEDYSERMGNFLRRSGEIIGIAVNTSRSRERMAQLLEQTRNQADELEEQQKELRTSNQGLEQQTHALRASENKLQQQQEELRQTNEELEEQTKALRESETRLQSQQDVLQQVNEELEERSAALEKQSEAIKDKNDTLEQIRADLARKARDLELTSRYKSEFLANMSHELRTPLNSLLILSQLLQANKEKNLSEKQVEFARTIHQSGSDLLTLINEILDLSKIEAGHMSIYVASLYLNNFSATIYQKFEHMAQDKNLDFQVKLGENAPSFIETDAQRLEQIIRNLLSNALKFTERGSVTLNIQAADADQVFQTKGLRADACVAFQVRDTGVGISPDKQQQIFEAFQQVDGTISRKYAGTGLGLSISKELAKLLGGEIHIESKQGSGSTFTLYLPLLTHSIDGNKDKVPVVLDQEATSSPTRPTVDSPAQPPPLEDEFIADDRKICVPNERAILIVEDDSKFASTLVDLSRERGFKALAAQNGETGLYMAECYKPSAILLDINLPGMDGMSVMSRLKDNADTRHIPVHFISGAEKNQEAMKMGAAGYSKKPVSMADLDSAFNRIESIISSPVKKLLVVEDDQNLRTGMVHLLEGSDLKITTVGTAAQTMHSLKEISFDCIILTLNLPDMSGFDLLDTIRADLSIPYIPVIVYTDMELTELEKNRLDHRAESVIVKSTSSPELLLDETILFLHRVASRLNADQRRMVAMVHDKEAIFKDKQVLLVDDDMRNVFALTSALEEKGMNVIVGRNGKESLERLAEHPHLNIILMDIMMPEMDGYQAIAEIRSNPDHRQLPIIALTAKAMKGDRKKCIDAGANDYVAKPVDTVKLLSLMRVWLY